MITNKQLIDYAKKALGHPYWYGTFGQISTPQLYYNKRKQYPTQYQWSLPKAQLNTRVFDCVGLIKAAIWSNADFSKNPKYKASEDVSANGMYERCKTKGAISSIPDIKGVLVFKDGHVGVYIGGGEVIEAMGHKYGVVKTKLKDRPFTHWGYCPYIQYIIDEKPEKEKPAAKYFPRCASDYLSIVDALESIHVYSKFSYRKTIAKANGINNYSGSYQQNVKMLNLLKAGKLKRP